MDDVLPSPLAVPDPSPHLTQTLQRWWSAALPDYAAALFAPVPPTEAAPLPAFWDALREESRRITGAEAAAAAVWATRVVATAHHTTPTNGPGFFAADRIATAGSHPVVVLAWSGVSLSNSAWSGCLVADDLSPALIPDSATAVALRHARADRQRDAATPAAASEDRLWLFPARQRDDLLYRLPLPARLVDGTLHADLRPEAADLLPPPGAAEDYPTWALQACAAIQRRALGIGPEALTYLDACRLVADTFQRDPDLLSRFLDDGPLRAALAGETWFYTRHQRRVAPLRPQPGGFSGRGAVLTDAQVRAGLADGSVCPGLVPSFLVLRGLVGLRCLGSFHQETYLRQFLDVWRALGNPVSEEVGPTLIMGRAREDGGREIHPLDRALQSRPLPVAGTVGDLWAPLLPRLGYILSPLSTGSAP